MIVIRPITLTDLDQLIALVNKTGYGLTTLPKDPAFLRRRIVDSTRGFQQLDDERPRGQSYLFVLEDTDKQEVGGTCAIVSKVGGFEPFYAYRIESEVHASEQLKVRKEVRTLHLVAEHDGPCEIGSLFLDPAYRASGVGRLLSLSRFLFMAEHPRHFDATVIAEMRGVIDDNGNCPFWEAIGRHFFDVDFPHADYQSILDKRFIADLMPKLPIYIPLLQREAQAVIGEVHEQTRPAVKLLESEGFTRNGMIDIFDGGPILSSPRDQIRTVRVSKRAEVSEVIETNGATEEYIIGRCNADFRVCKGVIQEKNDGTVRVSTAAAKALRVLIGDCVRYATLRG